MADEEQKTEQLQIVDEKPEPEQKPEPQPIKPTIKKNIERVKSEPDEKPRKKTKKKTNKKEDFFFLPKMEMNEDVLLTTAGIFSLGAVAYLYNSRQNTPTLNNTPEPTQRRLETPPKALEEQPTILKKQQESAVPLFNFI